MAYTSKYSGTEIDALLDKANGMTAFSGDYDDFALKSDIPSTDGLATTAYVDGKVAGLVGSAPEVLNTLEELASALGGDENFATTVAGQIGGKQDALSQTQMAAVNSGVTSADKTKIDAIESYTIGEGLEVVGGVLRCSFTPTRYYTGSTQPNSSTGNNGDLYLLIN